MKIKVVLEPSEEGGYTAYVPSLPGCISEGEDGQATLANISEAVALYLANTAGDRDRPRRIGRPRRGLP